jgi:hypothetical protein
MELDEIKREIAELDAAVPNTKDRTKALRDLLIILTVKFFEDSGEPSLNERRGLLTGIDGLKQIFFSGRYNEIDDLCDEVLDHFYARNDFSVLDAEGPFAAAQLTVLSLNEDHFLRGLRELEPFLR